jgi:hypothetical protein
MLVLAVALAGCSIRKHSGPGESRLAEESFATVAAHSHNTMHALVDPHTHDSLKWLDQGVTSSEAYPSLQTSTSVLDHISLYGITRNQFEEYLVNVRQIVIRQRAVDYDASRPITCYVDPWCGFGGGTVIINVPVRGASGGDDYVVYGLHIRLREVAYRYSTSEK